MAYYVLASPKAEGIVITAREIFVLIALVLVFIWVGWEVLKASRR